MNPFQSALTGIIAVAALAFPSRLRLDRASEPAVDCPVAEPVTPPAPPHSARVLPIRFNKLVAHREFERVRA